MKSTLFGLGHLHGRSRLVWLHAVLVLHLATAAQHHRTMLGPVIRCKIYGKKPLVMLRDVLLAAAALMVYQQDCQASVASGAWQKQSSLLCSKQQMRSCAACKQQTGRAS
jgi:hypothetical protein